MKIKVLGIDPSLRATGLGLLCYDKETKNYHVEGGQVLRTPQKITGTEAILYMMDALSKESKKPMYQEADHVLVESPAAIFNKNFSAASLLPVAHIVGGAAMAFGIDKTHLFRPVEWNRSRKKDKTHEKTQEILGDCETWGYEKKVKPAHQEHILDAISMALWWTQNNYE